MFGPADAAAWAETQRALAHGAVVKHEPQRMELRASLDHPVLVFLADAFDPGLHLTIDGRPAQISGQPP